MGDLANLLERVTAATGPDRELDADLWWLLHHHDAERYFNTGALGMPKRYPATLPIPAGLGRTAVRSYAPSYTRSLDAALVLVERKLPGWTVANLSQQDNRTWFAELREGFLTSYSRAVFTQRTGPENRFPPTPALALIAALLRALIAQEAAAAPPPEPASAGPCSPAPPIHQDETNHD